MPERKVQLKGGSTFTVSLPKEWALEQGVEAGMHLSVHPLRTGELLVTVDGEGVRRVPTVDADGTGAATVERVADALYCDGAEEFVFQYAEAVPSDHRRAAREVAGERFGLEVARRSEGELRFRTLLDAGRLSVDEVVGRMLSSALSLHRHATAAFVDGEGGEEGPLADRRRECHAQRALVERYFGSVLDDRTRLDDHDRTLRSMCDVAGLARELDEVAAAAERLAGAGEGTVQSADWRRAFDDAAREARSAVETAVEGTLDDRGPRAARDALDDGTDLRAAVDALDDRIDPDAGGVADAARATAALRRTVDATEAIATVGVGSAAR